MDYFVDLYIEKLSQYQIPSLDCHKLRKEFDLVWLDYSEVPNKRGAPITV